MRTCSHLIFINLSNGMFQTRGKYLECLMKMKQLYNQRECYKHRKIINHINRMSRKMVYCLFKIIEESALNKP